jgi:hypothetical protein
VMTQKFEMSMMGELNYFLGFQVKQLKDGTFISQMKYTQDLIKRFGMKDAKPAKTPMGTDGHIDLNKGGKSVDQKAYRSMIGSLLYLCASRPDIMLSVCMCARYSSGPRECHLVAVKRCRRFDPGGSLDRRVNCRCVPLPRWVGARRNTEGRNPRLRVVLRQSGCACSRGLQAFARERER